MPALARVAISGRESDDQCVIHTSGEHERASSPASPPALVRPRSLARSHAVRGRRRAGAGGKLRVRVRGPSGFHPNSTQIQQSAVVSSQQQQSAVSNSSQQSAAVSSSAAIGPSPGTSICDSVPVQDIRASYVYICVCFWARARAKEFGKAGKGCREGNLGKGRRGRGLGHALTRKKREKLRCLPVQCSVPPPWCGALISRVVRGGTQTISIRIL